MEGGSLESLNPLFSGQFAAVLQEALGREGTGSLFDGPMQSEPPKAERCPPPDLGLSLMTLM